MEVPRGAWRQAWHYDYSDYENTCRAKASTAALRASWAWPLALSWGGSATGGKQAGIWLGPMRPGNSLGREDSLGSGSGLGGGHRERQHVRVHVHVCMRVWGKQVHI